MTTKKYVSLSKLSVFLENLKNTFAVLGHKHSVSDISDFAVDSELSSTSTNPVQNKIIDAEFDAIAESFAVLEAEVDKKADAGTTGMTFVVGDTAPTSGLWFDTTGHS